APSARASRHPPRSRAGAARDAGQAAGAAARAANTTALDAAAVIRRETNRARDAAERAWEAVDEAADRPAKGPSASAVVLTSGSLGVFQWGRPGMRGGSAVAAGTTLIAH